MKTIKLVFIAVIALATFNSCSDDDDAPAIVNEEEVITTLTLTLTPDGGGADIVLRSQDLDGDGPDSPVVTVSGDLSASTTYTGSVEVLNELEDPAEDITEEVAEEDDEHQFFYQFTGAAGTTVTYSDADGDGNPVGIAFTVTTGNAAANASMTVTLRHEPNKDAAGVSDGDITNAGGETDIAVTFNFNIN